MNDRIEEYRMDWHSGPARLVRRAKTLRFRPKRPWLSLILILLVGTAVVYWKRWEPVAAAAIDDEVNRTKTGLEIAAALRSLRQYYLSHGSLPQQPEQYLKSSLRPNKAYSPGCDFWGTPYRVDRYFDGFGVRSAGPNRRFEDRDDLVQAVTYASLAPQ